MLNVSHFEMHLYLWPSHNLPQRNSAIQLHSTRPSSWLTIWDDLIMQQLEKLRFLKAFVCMHMIVGMEKYTSK